MAPPPPTREDAARIELDRRMFGFYVVDSETGARVDPMALGMVRSLESDRAIVVPISSPGGTVEAMRAEVLGLPWEVCESDYVDAFRGVLAPDPLLFIGAAANEGRP